MLGQVPTCTQCSMVQHDEEFRTRRTANEALVIRNIETDEEVKKPRAKCDRSIGHLTTQALVASSLQKRLNGKSGLRSIMWNIAAFSSMTFNFASSVN